MAARYSAAIATIASLSLATALILRKPQSHGEDGDDDSKPSSSRMTTLFCPPNPELDIVLVHGLETDGETAWSEKTPDGGEFCWPKTELPRRLEAQHGIQARITLYTESTNKKTSRSLFSWSSSYPARELIEVFSQYRQENHPLPIVFICHGLGGLIVKNALASAMASRLNDLNQVYEETAGIVFLGTPHSVSADDLSDSVSNIVAADPGKILFDREQFQESCNSPSILLFHLDRFKPLAAHLQICAIAESPSLSRLNPNLHLPTSPGINYIELSREHRNLCKFTNSDDENLEVIIRSIGEICTKVKKSPGFRKPFPEHRWSFVSDEVYDLGMDKILDEHCKTISDDQDSDQLTQLELCLAKWAHAPLPKEVPQGTSRLGSAALLEPLKSYMKNWMEGRGKNAEATHSDTHQYPLPICVLQGPPGCGKTETAMRYVNRNKDKYASVLWVNATNKKSIELSFRNIARTIITKSPELSAIYSNMPGVFNNHEELENQESHTIVQMVMEWLESPVGGSWLLVLDSLSLESDFPTPAAWADDYRPSYSLDYQSWQKLLRLVPSSPNGRGRVIITTTDNDPVLDPIAIRFPSGSLAEGPHADTKIPRPIPGVDLEVIIAWSRTAQTWERDVLAGILFLANRDCARIPLSVFKTGQGNAENEVELKIPQIELHEFYLYPSNILPDHGPNLLAHLFPEEQNKEARHFAQRAWQMLYQTMMEIRNRPDRIFAWETEAHMVKNVSTILLRCNDMFGSSEGLLSEIESWTNLAFICEDHADYKTAAALYQLERKKHKRWTQADFTLLLHCTRAYIRDNNFEAAQIVFDDVFSSQQIEPGRSERITAYRQFASMIDSKDGPYDAWRKLSQVLQLEDPFGRDAGQKQMIEPIGELAEYLSKSGFTLSAIAMYERLLISLKETLGMMHPTTMGAMKMLSVLRCWRAENDDAAHLINCVRDSQKQRLGNGHPKTFLLESEMAVKLVLNDHGREAEDIQIKCLDAAIQSLGLHHPTVFDIRENLFRILVCKEKKLEATVQFDKLNAEIELFPSLYSDLAASRIHYRLHHGGDIEGDEFAYFMYQKNIPMVTGGF